MAITSYYTPFYFIQQFAFGTHASISAEIQFSSCGAERTAPLQAAPFYARYRIQDRK